jgi:hypothetical protein
MSQAADSAGQPFLGRSFSANPFSGDSGEVDHALGAATKDLSALLEGDPEGWTHAELATSWGLVVEALRSARVLSPLIAEAGDWGVTEQGATVEKTQELSVPHLLGPDGRVVAPIFSDTGAMAAWNPEARPIPVEGSRAALTTASDGLVAMVLDPGSAGSRVFRLSALEALASGAPYVPPWSDDGVRAGFARVMAEFHETILVHRVVCGDPTQSLLGPEVLVVLGLAPGLGKEAVDALVDEISERCALDPVIAGRCDGVGLRILPA